MTTNVTSVVRAVVVVLDARQDKMHTVSTDEPLCTREEGRMKEGAVGGQGRRGQREVYRHERGEEERGSERGEGSEMVR